MSISNQIIASKLKDIIMKRLDFNFCNCDEKLLDSNLFGNKIGFVPSHLLYLLSDIENEFNIQIPENEIIAGKFSTFNNIAEIIARQMEFLSESEAIVNERD